MITPKFGSKYLFFRDDANVPLNHSIITVVEITKYGFNYTGYKFSPNQILFFEKSLYKYLTLYNNCKTVLPLP